MMNCNIITSDLRSNKSEEKSLTASPKIAISTLMHKQFPVNSSLYQLANFQTGFKLQAVQTAKLPKRTMANSIQQRNVTRLVKGAIADGFEVAALKVDKDGSIVQFPKSLEREECEEPRLPFKINEWDEVLKK